MYLLWLCVTVSGPTVTVYGAGSAVVLLLVSEHSPFLISAHVVVSSFFPPDPTAVIKSGTPASGMYIAVVSQLCALGSSRETMDDIQLARLIRECCTGET